MSAQSLYHTYDKKYRSLMGKFLPGEKVFDGIDVLEINGWKYSVSLGCWPRKDIMYAVYESKTAEAWQMFRVSLKGMETRMKLLRLRERLRKTSTLGQIEMTLEIIRIDNYIGALVRGGFLNKHYEVIK